MSGHTSAAGTGRCRSSSTVSSRFAVARRRPRKPSKRRLLKREPYKRVLIVCEGSKTEPLYFSEIRSRYRLSAANVAVVHEGSAPITVVKTALAYQKRERDLGEKYDDVVCVFDRDEHATFDGACALAKAKKLKLVRSWPCFEFWLLLHFGYTRKPYARSGAVSPADECVGDLKEHLPDYEKAQRGLFQDLEDRLKDAKANAQRTIVDGRKTNNPNPSTEIHRLVNYLQHLKADAGPAQATSMYE